jgi:hypothetical protein
MCSHSHTHVHTHTVFISLFTHGGHIEGVTGEVLGPTHDSWTNNSLSPYCVPSATEYANEELFGHRFM